MSTDAHSATEGKSLEALLERIQRNGKARTTSAVDEATTSAVAASVKGARTEERKKRVGTGRSSKVLVAAANHNLETLVHQRGLEQVELFPSSEYPTPLTRLPLFPPVTRETAIEMFKRGWTPLASRWDGEGVLRSGPALNIYDEDTLLGLMVLRSRRLKGLPDHLPVPLRCHDSNDRTRPAEVVEVDTLYFRMSQLETAIRGETPKGGWSGPELARRRQSLDDLSGLRLRFELPRGGHEYSRKTISLFDTPGFSKEKDACYYVQFHPLVSQWLESYRTYIDLALRRKFSDLGRAIHRFLASQRSNQIYVIELTAMYDAIGAQERVGKLNHHARVQLGIMQENGFLESFSITGTGRSHPFVLAVTFPAKAS
ncbi:hypothetical protein [Lamprocystis purpurea]|uniref:hypothetical protein n=1 Tax=Lamprocystis purpurea TaxID=61598 RepID=UPI0012F7CB8A|nr:hypothetical protein [Lamprocystis purpurea]